MKQKFLGKPIVLGKVIPEVKPEGTAGMEMMAKPRIFAEESVEMRPRLIDLDLPNEETAFVEEAAYPKAIPLKKRVTISDVAKLCGVTSATVSRVLNAKRKFRTSEELRQRILNTAELLGYVPDLAARNLNRQTTRIVGIFASPQTHISEGITNSLMEGLTEVFRTAGYDIFFDLSASANSDHALPFWRFDGAILLQAPLHDTVLELDRRRVSYVCVNERMGQPASSILADDRMGMTRAVDYLASLGHKTLAYAGAKGNYLSHYSISERPETFAKRARELGLTVCAGYDLPLSSVGEFLNRTVKSQGATAVITYDHHIAVEVVSAAHAMSLKIPEDFSLICFNDLFPVSLLPTPLTAISVSGREMGRLGAEVLLNVLNGHKAPIENEIRVHEELVLRASTAKPRKKKPA